MAAGAIFNFYDSFITAWNLFICVFVLVNIFVPILAV